MNDTSPEMERLYRKMLLERSNEERFMMGVQMFEVARTMILASLPEGLSEGQIRQALFLRLYGNDFDQQSRDRILQHLAG